MFYKAFLFLGVCGIASASNCKPQEALNNFIMKAFEGKWYDLNIISTNFSKSDMPDNLRCSTQRFAHGYKKYRYMSDLYLGNEHRLFPLSVKVSDSTVAHMTSGIMDVNVVCTDYNNWAVSHYCLSQNDMNLDLYIVMGRRKDAYNALVTSNQLLNNCLHKHGVSLAQGWKMDHDSCPN